MASFEPVFFFDAHVPPALAEALTVLGENAKSSNELYPPKTPDTVWLRDIGERGWCVLTRDVKILRRPHERAAMTAHSVGVFFLLPGSNSPDRCKMIQTIIKHWPTIKRVAISEPRPFQYEISERGVKPFRPSKSRGGRR